MYDDYYHWLESLVNDGNHSRLIRYLYEYPFRWQFTLDSNRAAGGVNLRSEFAYEQGVDIQDVRSGPCSVLEMLIALSKRMVEILTMDISDWFWDFLRNLGLDRFDDYNYDENGVNYILNVWLNRAYDSHGNGSLFPLSDYSGDCRNLDIWGQMNAWIEEHYPHDNKWLYE